MEEIKKTYIHVDMDAFFASVEQLDHPEWKGKPVIVGGLPDERRSVVSTASYEARKFGVHSAMPTQEAYRLCPQGIFTHGNYKHYSEISEKIMEILNEYSPEVIQLSIDEACVNLTGTEKLFGNPENTALEIKQKIKEKTGLTVSIGLAGTKYLAKLASEVNKPDGFYKIENGKETDFMLSLPLEKIWGIGKKTLENLHNAGFFHTKQLYEKSISSLTSIFGENAGSFFYNILHGIEVNSSEIKNHSISNETTFPYDLKDIYTIETYILEICSNVFYRLKKQKSFSKTVTIKIRYEDFSTTTIQETFFDYISSVDDLFSKAKKLFEKKYKCDKGIRLLGVGLNNVELSKKDEQGILFDFGEQKKQKIENALIKLEEKHPEIKVTKARLLTK